MSAVGDNMLLPDIGIANIDHSANHLTCAQLMNQLDCAVDRNLRIHRFNALDKAGRGIR